jgi:hypothetical protein
MNHQIVGALEVGVPFLSELVDYFHGQKRLPNLT